MERGITWVNGRHLTLVQIAQQSVEEAQPLMNECFRYGEEELAPLGSKEVIFGNCAAGLWQFFTILENSCFPLAGMLTEISQRPNGRFLVILWIGGRDLKAFMKFFPRFEQWALVAGCDYIEAWTRKGLTRILPQVGLEVEQYIMRKKIERTEK